jgi:hypothetical protein
MPWQNRVHGRSANVCRRRLWRTVGALLATTLLSLGCAAAVWNYQPTELGLRTPITAPARLSVRVDSAPSQVQADELAAGIRQDLEANAFPNTVEENPALDVTIDVTVGARTGFPYGCLTIAYWFLGVPLGKCYGRSEVTVFVADATGTRLARYTAASEQGALYGVVLGIPYGCWTAEDQIPAAVAAAIDSIKQDIASDRSRLAKAALQAPLQQAETAAAIPKVSPSQPRPTPGIIQLAESVGDTLDLAERNRHDLFPGIASFQWAVVSRGPDSLLTTKVVRISGQVPETLRLRLTAGDLERITFLIQNPELVQSQAAQSEDARVGLARFWGRVESNLVAGKPRAQVRPGPAKSSKAGVVAWAVRGAGIGAAAGGLGASAVVAGMPGEMRVLSGDQSCSDMGPYSYTPTPVYAINQGAFCGIAGGALLVGAAGGAVAGTLLPARLPQARVRRTPEGTQTIVVGTVLGVGAGLAAFAGVTGLCQSIAESGPDPKKTDVEVTCPGIMVGTALACEIIRAFHRIADAIDRRAAASRVQESPEIQVRPRQGP